MSEFDYIESIRRRCAVRPPVERGIGDDAAVLRHRAETCELVTTDMLMEGVDFLCDSASPAEIGRKSLAVNLSDIAAMGGRPTAAFVSVAFPRARGVAFAEQFFQGVWQLAEEYAVTIAGGDTNTWDGPLVCSITVLGEPVGQQPILRSGALPGDVLCVTGALGGSIASRHLSFTPRIREVARLVELVEVHAMLDISDGLAADLHHLAEESQVGAILRGAAIPIHPDTTLSPSEQTPLQRALGDGEDFELLFTVSAADAERLVNAWRDATPITVIGEIIAERKVCLADVNGTLTPLPPSGWVHDFGAQK